MGKHAGRPERGLSRLVDALAILLHIAWLRIAGANDQRSAEAMRKRIERAGGVWIKLGQALALRRDLLPSVYCEQLGLLLDAVPPFAFARAAEIVAEELGAPVEEFFTYVDPVPIASASIGQVHRAWRGSETFAVKIQRPGLERRFAIDFAIMRYVARIGDRLGIGGGMSLGELLDEFVSITARELNYREEAFAALLLARNAAGRPSERHVASIAGLSGRRVLTTRFAEGVPLGQLMDSAGPTGATAELEIRRQRIAENLLWNTLTQIYRFGVFHADPHPANLFVGADDGLTYIDHGQIGRMHDNLRKRLLAFARSLAEQRIDDAVSALLEIALPTGHTNLRAMRRDAEFALARHGETMRYGTPEDRRGAIALDLLILDIARRHRLAVPAELTLYLKTISTVDSVVRALAPALDLYAIQYRFFAWAALRDLGDGLRPHRLLSTVHRLYLAIDTGLALVARLDETADGVDALTRLSHRRLAQLSLITLFGLVGAGIFYALWVTHWRPALGVPVATLAVGCLAAAVLASLGSVRQALKLRDSGRRPPQRGHRARTTQRRRRA